MRTKSILAILLVLISSVTLLVSCGVGGGGGTSPYSNEGSQQNPLNLGTASTTLTHSGSVSAYGTSFYTFKTGTISGSYTLSLTNTHSDLSLSFADPAFTAPTMVCDNFPSPGANDEICSFELTANTDYYLAVDEWDTVAGTYTLGITAPTVPYIYAQIFSLPTGSSLTGYKSGHVEVLDDNTGVPITTAIVTMNNVTLSYNSTDGAYDGNVVVAPGEIVTLNVTIGGKTYTASGSQLISYPRIVQPAPGTPWAANTPHSIQWSGNYPTTNTSLGIGLLDAAAVNGQFVWPLDGYALLVPSSETSYSIPANSLTQGNRLAIVSIYTDIPVTDAAMGSVLTIGGFNYSPVTVADEKSITAFSFTAPSATGIIDGTAKTIRVNVPSGTDVTGLVAAFFTTGQSVKVGGTIQVSGVTPNDFTSPVTYTVTASDGLTQDYIVTVVAGALAAQWAQTVTAGNSTSNFTSVSVASDGSVYAAGYIYGSDTYNFGNSVTAAGPSTSTSTDIVLVKYNSAGVAQWAQTAIAGNRSQFNSVSAASDGSVYAAGFIYGTGTYNFGNSVTAKGTFGAENIVLVKYNSSGVAQWAQTVTAGNNSSTFNSVSVASDGSVYAAGYIYGTSTINFGNSVTAAGTFSGANPYNLVLVKYNSSGVAQWAQTVTEGNSISSFSSVSVASDGSVYAAGYIYGSGTYNFGNSVTAAGSSTSSNTILVKYSSSGIAQWAQTVTAGNGSSVFMGVSVASDGSVYAAGYIGGTGTYDFGYSVTAAAVSTGYNIVLVKYNSSGAAQWAQTVTAGNQSTEFTSVSVGADGSVYTAGYIHQFGFETGVYNFGNGVTVASISPLSDNLILVKYNSSGVAQRARAVVAVVADSNFNDSRFNGVAVASDGSVFAAGYIYGTGVFNFGDNITAAGSYSNYFNVVLLKYN